jgi:hypothetical protein
MGVRPILLHPRSQGKVSLGSADASAPVRIAFNFLSERNDLTDLRDACRLGFDIAPDSMDFSMRGWSELLGSPVSKTHGAQAKQLFDSALRLDPENVDAMIGKAGSLSNEMINGWSVSFIEDKKQATDLIDRALSKSPRNWRAHLVKGNILLFGQPEEALAHFDA